MSKTPIFAIEPRALLPIAGTEAMFPVRRIYCIGRNYAAHAREMGADPTREPPFFFQKAADTVQICPQGETVSHSYPPMTANYHFEAEMVVALQSGGRDIAETDALSHVFGYAVGLDMTRRDLQFKMREQGRPWEIGKAFDHSAPVGVLHRRAETGDVSSAHITLTVNGEVRQQSQLTHLIWSVAETIANLSTLFALQPGDLVFTGTPGATSQLSAGDRVEVEVGGVGVLSNVVAAG